MTVVRASHSCSPPTVRASPDVLEIGKIADSYLDGGIAIAYWVNFGIRNTPIEFRWRFPLGLMAVLVQSVLLAKDPR